MAESPQAPRQMSLWPVHLLNQARLSTIRTTVFEAWQADVAAGVKKSPNAILWEQLTKRVKRGA